MSGRIAIPGRHLVTLQFERVPSINEYIRESGRSNFHAGRFQKKWRVTGHKAVEEFLVTMGCYAYTARADGTIGIGFREPLLMKDIFVRYLRAGSRDGRRHQRSRLVRDLYGRLNTKLKLYAQRRS